MSAGWKIVWLAAAAGAIAFVMARVLVPDVVPVGYAEDAQASWAVLTAFVLRTIELMSLWVAAIALCVMLGVRLKRVISPDSRHRPSRSSR
jgi:type II secretory pathway component PulF